MAGDTAQKHEWAWLGLVLLLSFAVFAKSIGNGFTYDDAVYVKVDTIDGPNTMVKELHPISEYFQKPYGYRVAQGRGFRPVTTYSFALTHHAARRPLARQPDPRNPTLFTDPPMPHHVINVLLHVLATFLVFRLLRPFGSEALPALLGAGLFGLTPLHADPVASIVGRGELFGFVFGAAGTLLYVRGVKGTAQASWVCLASSCACMFLAFCSKEGALAWAPFLALYLFGLKLFREPEAALGNTVRATLKQLAHAIWVVGVPLALFFVARALMLAEHEDYWIEGGRVMHQGNPLFRMAAMDRIPTAVMVLGYGLYKLFLPWFLCSDYGGPVFPIVGWGDYRFLGALLLLLAILATGLLAGRRHPLLLLAVLSFFVFTFITSNILVPIETIFGERLLYSAVLAQSFLVVWLVHRCRGIRPWRTVLLGIYLAWVLVLGTLGFLRTFDWQSNDTLFIGDADKQPYSSSMNMNAARIFRLRSDWKTWRYYIDRVIKYDPGNAIPYNDLGVTLLERGQPREAEKYLKMALKAKNVEIKRDTPSIYMNLARCMEQTGRREQARDCWRQVLQVRPDFFPARHQLLLDAFNRGDETTATRLIEAGERVETDDDDTPWYTLHRGMWASRRGDHPVAVNLLGEAIGALLKRGMIEMPATYRLIDSMRRIGRQRDAQAIVEQFLRVPNLDQRDRVRLLALRRELR